MWTLIDSLTLLASLAVHAGLFFLAHQFRHSSRLEKLGATVLNYKEKSLQRSPILRFFSWNVDQGRDALAAFTIGLLIFLKGMMMLLTGIFFGSILLVPVQGALMSVLIVSLQKKGMPVEALKKTQNLQLGCMLWLNAIGNLIGYHYWVNKFPMHEMIDQYRSALVMLIAIGFALSMLTASHEVQLFKKHRTFLG